MAEPASGCGLTEPDLSGLSQAIHEHAPLPMATVEGPGHIVRYVNPAFCRLVDKLPEQLAGKPFADIVPENDPCLMQLERVFRTGKSESQTGQHDPELQVYWSWTMWPVLVGERQVGVMIQVTEGAQFDGLAVAMNEALILGSVRQHELTEAAEKLNVQLQAEMAERKQAEQALRQNEWRLRYATESARLTFVEIDHATGVARTPDNFFAVMGYVPPAGQHGSVGARLLLEHVVAHDRQRVDAALQQFFGGQSVGKLEYQVLGDDRIERWIETRWSTEFDPDGKILTSFATNIDITERKQAEQAMRQFEERYHNLFNSIDEGFCVIKVLFDENDKPVDYLFLEVNPAFEKQSGILEAKGKRMREIAPDIEGHWFEIYGEVALTGQPLRFVNEAKALEDRWFDVYAFRVGSPDSRKVAVIFNNITERKQSEHRLQEQTEALTELDRRKDEFLAMLSHELRNPLAALSNAVHLLRLQKNEDPVQRQTRGVIARQVTQMKHLVDDLLEISRITTGRVHLRRERIALGGIVERAIETIQPLMGQRGHALTLALPPDPVWLQADAARLEQVLVNLLTNAAKYTGEGGHIWLELQQEDNEAVLRVRDTGIGIAPELLPRIFDLFTQADRSLDRSQGGLGIGLCLVQRLVELHGGTVAASSVLGRGSEFVVRLPAIPSHLLQLTPPSPTAETAQPTRTGCRILVVDDNLDAAQSLADLLEATGHVVKMAHDGPAALQAIQEFPADVVLLDIGLPGLTGLEVARRMRQVPGLKNMVLVAMTGYGREADRERSREAGFDHHLVKPADFDELEKILATVGESAHRVGSPGD